MPTVSFKLALLLLWTRFRDLKITIFYFSSICSNEIGNDRQNTLRFTIYRVNIPYITSIDATIHLKMHLKRCLQVEANILQLNYYYMRRCLYFYGCNAHKYIYASLKVVVFRSHFEVFTPFHDLLFISNYFCWFYLNFTSMHCCCVSLHRFHRSRKFFKFQTSLELCAFNENIYVVRTYFC